MSEQESDQKVAFYVVGIVVAALVAAVVSFGACSTRTPPTAAVAADEAPAAIGEALAKVYFELGQAALTPDTEAALGVVVEAANAAQAKIVLISGFHDASGDAARNAELAKQRAIAVRDFLAAKGIASERIKLSKPAETLGGNDANEARRVELRVQ